MIQSPGPAPNDSVKISKKRDVDFSERIPF